MKRRDDYVNQLDPDGLRGDPADAVVGEIADTQLGRRRTTQS